MAFIASVQPADALAGAFGLAGSFRKRRNLSVRRRFADEDGARRALGSDGHLPVAVAHGTSLENLARIAFG